MLDSDLAELYGVPTGRLNEQVKRNICRFPDDFMFQINKEEAKNLKFQSGMSSSGPQSAILNYENANLKSQIAISSFSDNSADYGGRRTLPYAFTELGIAMLSSVLNSERAVQVNIMIMRAFVKLRQTLAQNKELADKFQVLEGRVGDHETVILQLVDEINRIKNPEQVVAIGFELPRREGDG
ncbi:MAG: ORF6N domain-containing protein [Candidatus Margulisbacteria bacterium]|nr:ORF6N domain-containing protein [Candidatus Margulisiibacteriota bacterium]